MSKPCTLCKLDKELHEYYKDKYKSTGYNSRCIACIKHIKSAKTNQSTFI